MPEREREGPPGSPGDPAADRPETAPSPGRARATAPDPAADPAAPDPAADPAVPAAALELPAAFGKYYLTEKLATGGMAEIYLAKIIGPGGFEKPLVIKQIHPRLSGQRHFVDLFVAEAKTLVTLAHGNIVPVYELGVIDDTYFIAMDYIDGPTLYRLTETLRRRGARMDPAIAAWITARVLEGLDYAHHKGVGVIHRDLSPRNVMLSRDGEVKLVDFGIAVTLGSGSEDDGQSAPTGSFPYMSPEQVRKEPLTAQTDLFSVGVLFWEMLVGHRLFARPDPDATLRAVVEGDIARPSRENPDIPGKLDEVVMRALERDMTARWTSAGDMLAALQRYLYSLDETPGPRDIAALVAKYCPPETRRFPTHHDVHGERELADATQPRGRAASSTPAGDTERSRPGPMTAVIPRDGAPRGKRLPRARTETFATHVALEQILEGAAPAPITGEGSGGAGASPRARQPSPSGTSGPSRPSRPSGPSGPRDDDPTPIRPTPRPAGDRAARAEPPAIDLPGRVPPSRGALVLAGIGATVLAVASIVVFVRGREAIERRDAMQADAARPAIDSDAGAPLTDPDSQITDAGAQIIDPGAQLPDAGAQLPDAGAPPSDAPPPRTRAASPPEPGRDAGPRPPRPDPRVPVEPPARADAGAARPAGTATLTIGANPWGNVLVDGKRIGRTPIERLPVSAGRHVVEVIFGGEDPPRTLRYTVDLADGEARDVLADFTRPP
jgi:eukaryotic-like serine/threonine-protein kinase